jgi:mono/diheme cytochrome c family protein
MQQRHRRTTSILAFLVVLALAFGPSGAADHQDLGPWFTEEQATRGQAQYRAHCAACHGAQLEGVVAPALAGSELFGAFTTLYDVFEYVDFSMPPSNPGGLPEAVYADIYAYILSFAGYPTGDTELPYDAELYRHIVLVPQGE